MFDNYRIPEEIEWDPNIREDFSSLGINNTAINEFMTHYPIRGCARQLLGTLIDDRVYNMTIKKIDISTLTLETLINLGLTRRFADYTFSKLSKIKNNHKEPADWAKISALNYSDYSNKRKYTTNNKSVQNKRVKISDN